MVLSENKHYRSSHITIERAHDGGISYVVVIKTDLILNREDPAYDQQAVDQLLADIERYVKANDHVDKVHIETEG